MALTDFLLAAAVGASIGFPLLLGARGTREVGVVLAFVAFSAACVVVLVAAAGRWST